MILFVRVCNTFCLDTFCPSYFQVNTFCPDTFCPTIVFPPTIKQSGLMLLILMCGNVAMNPGPVLLGLVNARSIWNKGPLLSDTIASHAFDFLCLTETHIRTTDLDSFLCFITPDGFSLTHRPRSSGIGGRPGVKYMEPSTSTSTITLPSCKYKYKY